MASIDDELRSLSPLPDSLQKSCSEFLRTATQHGCTFTGMLIRIEPSPIILVIGNVREKGKDLADLFRLYADLIEEKKDETIPIQATPIEND